MGLGRWQRQRQSGPVSWTGVGWGHGITLNTVNIARFTWIRTNLDLALSRQNYWIFKYVFQSACWVKVKSLASISRWRLMCIGWAGLLMLISWYSCQFPVMMMMLGAENDMGDYWCWKGSCHCWNSCIEHLWNSVASRIARGPCGLGGGPCHRS